MNLRHSLALALSALLANSASAYQVSGSKWEDGEFVFYVGVPATVPSLDFDDNPVTWNYIIAQAAGAWSSNVPGLDIEIVQETRNPCDGYTGDEAQTVNVSVLSNGSNPARDNSTAFENGIGLSENVCGSRFGKDVVAVTLLQTSPSQPQFYREADIIFNQGYQYDLHNRSVSDGTASAPYDVRRIAIKHIGQALGLRDEVNFSSIMHPNTASRSVTNPTADDLTGMRVLYPSSVSSNDPSIRLAIEEPNNSQIKSGISNIRGWAVGLKDIRLVELSINNGAYVPVPYGSIRPDVSSVFSQYPKSGNSGFSMIFNWASLSTGQHQIRMRAHDVDDNVVTVNRNFTVARFDDDFVNSVDITGSSAVSNQKTVTLNNVRASNKNYDIKLEWDNAAQKFNIVSAVAD